MAGGCCIDGSLLPVVLWGDKRNVGMERSRLLRIPKIEVGMEVRGYIEMKVANIPKNEIENGGTWVYRK